MVDRVRDAYRVRVDLGLVRHQGGMLDGSEVEDGLLRLGVVKGVASEEGGGLMRVLLLMVDVGLHLIRIL
jgi:hypothetical protein